MLRSLAVVLAGLLPLGDSGGFSDPVTHLGVNLLPRTDLVLRGQAGETARAGPSTSLASFRAMEVLYGAEERERVVLLSPDPTALPSEGTECVLFLKRLGEGRYEPVATVGIGGEEGETRLGTLRKYLEIEAIADGKAKRRALRDLLMSNLASEDTFLLFSAARELAHFTRKNAGVFDEADARAMARRAAGTSNALLKELLGTALQNLGRDPGEEAEEEDGEARGPPSPEFLELRATWEKGGLDAERRLALMREICTRHLRHAAPVLLAALSDEDERVRELAAFHLGVVRAKKAEGALVGLLTRERSREVLAAAVRSLGVLGSRQALPAIVELGRDPELLRTVAFAARRIGGPEADAYLEGLRKSHAGDSDREREVRKLVDFLLSDEFVEQEKALEKVRRRRLR